MPVSVDQDDGTRARYAGHQKLVRGRRHDLGREPLRISLIPMSVIAVPEQHGVDMAIPETGKQIHAFGRDDFGVVRHNQRSNLANRFDPFALDEDHAIRERRPAEAINQASANQGGQPPGWPRR